MTIDGKRAWVVLQNGRIWKKPRSMKAALALARRLLWNSKHEVIVRPVVVPVKHRHREAEPLGDSRE